MKIKIDQNCINSGTKEDAYYYAIGLGIRRDYPLSNVTVEPESITVNSITYNISPLIELWIGHFDEGKKVPEITIVFEDDLVKIEGEVIPSEDES